jgi:glycerophosphoryl diester phosphodiesterase
MIASRLPVSAHPLPPVAEALHPAHARVLVAAHRGAWKCAPENSLAAIDLAVALGADIVECDVRATRDGVLVLLHDATLDRMTDLEGEVADIDWPELRKARLRQSNGGADRPLTAHRPATLSEALECARGRVLLNVDTKAGELVDDVARATLAAGMADQVFVKAFVETPGDMEALRASPFFGQVPFVPMLKAKPGTLRRRLESLAPWRFPMYEVEFVRLAELEETKSELTRQQARLWVNTIQVSHSLDFNDQRALLDPDAVWGALLDVGVRAIQTDEVGALLRYLDQRGMR